MPSLRKRIILKYQELSSDKRSFPDFIIIGAQKSGTTSMYAYLEQHPDIIGSLNKEIHFFDGGTNPNVDNFKKGINWYKAHFPLCENVENKKIYEASPLYIFSPPVPKRIANYIPKVKVIALLRNPSDRAISHYFHNNKRERREKLDIMGAFEAEEKRLEKVLLEKNYKSNIFRNFSYKRRGHYKEQLDRYFNYFSKDQIHVLNSEAFFSNPHDTLTEVFNFVGVNPNFKVRNLKPKNIGRKKESVSNEVYNYLSDYFNPHNEALYKLLNQDFNW